MLDYAQALADALGDVQRPGNFYVAGSFDIHPPRLEVEGVGPIALPLLPVQAESLVAMAEQAPYGRGTETLVDTAVRRTWQVDAARVRLTGQRWAADLAAVVEQVRQGLAVAGAIEAQLYKLLIYDTGSFFVPHRDTEKVTGMFATLVVVLPCDYSGGELIIRHRGQEAHVDLHRDEPAEAAFAAFYADCVHEVLPIASGYRLALIYNLTRMGEGPLPQAPDYGTEQARLAQLLGDWDQSGAAPDKLVYPLEHAYTEAEIGFAALKGKDAAVAQVLIPAVAAARCDLYLALISVSESGWADYTGRGGWRDPELEIGEVTASHWRIHDWRLPDGGKVEMGQLPFDQDELAPPEALADLDEAEPEFSEATGNEGATFERFYQSAALILWPMTRRGAVLAAGGLGVSIPALRELAERWAAAGAKAGDELWHETRGLASAIRAHWPAEPWSRRQASAEGRTRDLLEVLTRLGDLEGGVEFITQKVAAGAYGQDENAALAAVVTRLPPGQAAELLGGVIAANVAQRPGACAGLLARCLETNNPHLIEALPVLAKAWLEGLPDGRLASPSPLDYRDLPEALTSTQLAEAVTALERIDAALASQAVARFLSLLRVYDPDRLLLPTALLLKESVMDPEPVATRMLRMAVLAHLETRIALPLEPPADWARPAAISCNCADCRELSRFLASPSEPTWHFKANEAQRRHVTDSIHRTQCDLDLATNKRGRPFTLICAKNLASFNRRVRQREGDLQHRERLAG